MRHLPHPVHLLILGVVLIGPAIHAERDAYVAHGEISRTAYDEQGKIIDNEQAKFEFRLASNRWSCSIEEPGGAVASFLIGDDSTNLYAVIVDNAVVPGISLTSLPSKFVAGLPKSARLRLETGYTNVGPAGSAVISYDVLAPDLETYGGPLWIAFGSAPYFAQSTNTSSAPCVWMWGYSAGQEVRRPLILLAQDEIADGPLALPKHIVFGRPRSELTDQAARSFQSEGTQSRLASAEYTVEDSTNLASGFLPTRFRLDLFSGVTYLLGAPRRIYLTISGRVLDLAVIDSTDIPMPIPPKGFTVDDRRSPNGNPVKDFHYKADETGWKSIEQVTNNAAYQEHLAKATAYIKHRQHKAGFMLWILILILVQPPLVAWILKKRRAVT
jgi:hypothetical protein